MSCTSEVKQSARGKCGSAYRRVSMIVPKVALDRNENTFCKVALAPSTHAAQTCRNGDRRDLAERTNTGDHSVKRYAPCEVAFGLRDNTLFGCPKPHPKLIPLPRSSAQPLLGILAGKRSQEYRDHHEAMTLQQRPYVDMRKIPYSCCTLRQWVWCSRDG